MTKRFKLHIDWFNYDKTDGEATLSDNGQPLLESDCVEDMRRLKDLLNEQHEEIMDLRLEITKMKLTFIEVVEDLEKQAESKEPIIISNSYPKWIRENVDLRLNGEKELKR